MKVVFPCKGSIVLTKEDVQILEAFYNTNLITSKVYQMYQSSNLMMQVGNFNYLPKNISLVVDETKFLSITKMRTILDSTIPQNQAPTQSVEDDKISDDDILSNSFFQTLKPLN